VIRRLVLAALVLAVTAACGAQDNGGAVGGTAISATGSTVPAGALHDRLPAAIAAAGTMRVGLFAGRAPFEFSPAGLNQPAGLDAELAQALGRVFGVSVAFVNEPIAALAGSLGAHRVDAVLSALPDEAADRAAGMDFVDYLAGSSAVLVLRSNPARVSSADDLCGRVVGVVAGTGAAASAHARATACAARGKPAMTVREWPDHESMVAELVGGRIAAVLDDTLVATYAAQSSVAPAELSVVGAPVDPFVYGIAVAKDAKAWRDALVAALRTLQTDGTYGAILNRWGAAGDAVQAGSGVT
jgi:polar amino acid transport system substrate-binding protein